MMAKRRRGIFILAGLALILLLLLPGYFAWQWICGNVPISFYGRVVDDEGKGVPGVQITFRFLYSSAPVMPVMYGQNERRWFTTVTTDTTGNFDVNHVYGYSVSGASGVYCGKAIGLIGVGLKPEDDPLSGVRMDDLFSRGKLPDTPVKRTTYHIVALK